MPYRCRGKCRFEEPMEYNTRRADAWCTVCRVAWLDEMPNIRCYCCSTILARTKQSSGARRKRTLMVARY